VHDVLVRKSIKTIFINLNSPIPTQEILAHELGHYFVDLEAPNLDKDTHEKAAKAFAAVFISQVSDF